jgi:transmembrane sensor
MKSYDDYLPFNSEDFLTDAPFREWVTKPTPEMTAYWRGLLHTYPLLREPFEQARLLAQGLEATWIPFSDTYTGILYQQLQANLPTDEPTLKPVLTAPQRMVPHRMVPQWVYAAAALVTLLLGFWGYSYFFREQSFQTGNAQVRTVGLYDGSVVTLNANSQLRVPSRMDWQTSRQVWLSGEGSFAVRRQKANDQTTYQKFTVHTHRADVLVLGTHFTVYTRSQRTQVLLEEGRIVLADPTTRKTLTMYPGQLVAYLGKQAVLSVEQLAPVKQRSLTAWRNNLLVFSSASMVELAARFQEVYGLKLILKGEAFDGQEFIGELPISDLPKALLIISESFGLKAVRENDRIYFVAEE